jgi:hypothetical protein
MPTTLQIYVARARLEISSALDREEMGHDQITDDERKARQPEIDERLRLLARLSSDVDLLETCFKLKIHLAEVIAAIAHGRMIRQMRRRALNRLRVTKSRALARGKLTRLPTIEGLQKHHGSNQRERAALWVHAGLYQYLVREHGYLAASRSVRGELDGLVMTLVKKFGFGRADEDYASLRRYRRLLARRRPRLF